VKFTYEARDDTGSAVYGEVEARDMAEAEREIQLLGLTPVDVARSDAPARPGDVPRPYTETSSDRATGVAAGCAAGWLIGVCLVAVGLLLTLTGIGALIGIPLILFGIVFPFVGPFLGLGSIRGACPHCGAQVRSTKSRPGATCPACLRRIVIRDGRYYRVD
jgi:hypothetical protein